MKIKNYIAGDEIRILELFKTTFKKELSKEYWYWRFANNPAGNHKIKLMWESDTLVGHYAVSPVKIRIGSDIYNSALSMTTMTHPDYSGKGIFGLLANDLYKDLEQNDNCMAIWGFPNNNSHYGFVKNLSWSNVGQISHLTLPKGKLLAKLSNNVSNCLSFDQEQVKCLRDIYYNKPVSLEITEEYLNWRYIQNPTEKYYIFSTNNSPKPAFLVVKLYPQEDHFNQDVFITEIGFTEDTFIYLSELLSHILAYFRLTNSSINLWMSIFDKRYILLEKLGFIAGGKPTYLGIRANNLIKEIVTDYRNWYISYGYSDIY